VNDIDSSKPASPANARKGIYGALVAAQRAAKAVDKGSVNSFHRYKYASAEAIIEEAREALSSAGLAVYAAEWHVSRAEGAAHAAVRVVYVVAHESGESLTCETETSVVEEKGRPADKAEATALTYSLGYFLRSLLLLPRVEPGSEVDQRDDGAREVSKAPRFGPPPAAPSPKTVPAPPPVSQADADALVVDLLGSFANAATLAEVKSTSEKVKASAAAFTADSLAVLRGARDEAAARLGGAR